MTQTLTAALARQIRDKPVTQDDLAMAARYVLDALANAAAGQTTAPGHIVRSWAAREGRSARAQAFAWGALAHMRELDDLHRSSVVHPGCVVVPAAWAVAAREGASGAALLTAVLWGYEAACRIGMGVGPAHYRIWHNTATCGPFGAAMAASHLLKLDLKNIVDALGNAGTQASGLWQFLATGAMTKHLHAGRAAEAGVLAADLAALGFTGPPAILEGDKGFFAGLCPDADPGAVLRDPDAPWQLHLTSLKPWGCCRHTHPAIDAALALAGTLDPAAIAAVEVTTYPAALDVCDRPQPESDYAAQFSLQHTVAAALTGAAFGPDSFAAARRAALAPLRAKVRVQAGAPFARAYPADWGAEVAVTLLDGARHAVVRAQAKGDPEAPLSLSELEAKAQRLFADGGVGAPVAAVTALLSLPESQRLPALPPIAGY